MRFTRSIPSGVWLVLGTAILVLTLLPTALVPLNGDDFPQYLTSAQFKDAWSTIFHGIGVTQHNRFAPLDIAVLRLWALGAYTLSGFLHVEPSHVVRAGVSLLVWLTTASAAFAWRRVARFIDPGAEVGFARTFCALTVAIAATLQIHAGFSFDPTVSISHIAYPVTALSFLLVGLFFSAISLRDARVSPGRLAGIFAVSMTGVLLYEQSVATVVALVAFAGLLVITRQWTPDRRTFIGLMTALAIVPGLVSLAGRVWANSAGAVDYAGTQLALGRSGLAAWGRLILSAFPGSAWPLAGAYVGDRQLPGTFLAAPIALALLCAVALALLVRSQPPVMRYGSRAALVAVGGLLWFGLTIAQHGFRAKYARELASVGEVYISYAATFMLAAVATVACAGAVEWRRAVPTLTLASVLVLMLVAGQSSLNWRVSSTAAHAMRPNRELLDAVQTPGLSIPERCRILARWSDGPWPSYYRARVTVGANLSYRDRFHEPFCRVSTPPGRRPERLP